MRYCLPMTRTRAMWLMMFVGATTLASAGCASRFEKLTRTRAATDFSCPESDVAVEKQRASLVSGQYSAKGCDRSDEYVIDCNLFGVCKTLSSEEMAARQAAYARQRAARPQQPPPSSAPAPAASPSSSSSSSTPSLPRNCSFNSDCGPNVKCNSGRCANTEGSSCGFDSDCGGDGAKCNSRKCSTAPDGKCSFNSECPGGSCNSGKCRF